MRRSATPALAASTPLERARLVLLLLAVALAVRWAAFGNPMIQVDEEFYLLVAQKLAGGALPYVDIWDRKPIGLFLLYLPPALLPPAAAVLAYQALALAFVVATAWLIVRVARAAGWGRGAVPAALAYILWLDLADGQGGQSPVFYNLFVVGAVALIVRAGDGARASRAGIAAIALLGLAMQVKYTVLFEGVGIGLWLAWQRWTATRSLAQTAGHALALCVVALLPTLAAAGVYAALGHLDAFTYANFLSIFDRGPDGSGMRLENAVTAAVLLGPLVVMAALGIGATPASPEQRRARLFLYGWFAVALAGFVAFGDWFNHYTLPVMLPGALCSAGFLASARAKRWLVLPGALAVFFAGQWLVRVSEVRRGTRAQFAAIVRAIGPGPGSLYVDWGEPAFYTFTGRRPLSAYVFPSHLQIAREEGAIGVDQATEVARIFAQRPDVVVLMGPPADTEENPAIYRQVTSLVARGGYAPPRRLPLGRIWTDVYHRRPAPR